MMIPMEFVTIYHSQARPTRKQRSLANSWHNMAEFMTVIRIVDARTFDEGEG